MREILYARVDSSRITVRDGRGRVLEVLPYKMGSNEEAALKRAGYYILLGGWAPMLPDGKPVTLLVRRRITFGRPDENRGRAKSSGIRGGLPAPIAITGEVTNLSSAVDAAVVEEVRAAVEDLQRRHDVRLWVVYVDAFSASPARGATRAVDWAHQNVELSKTEGRDAVLAIATEERSYAFLVSGAAAGRGGQAGIDILRINSIEPALHAEQWAAAGVAAATGLAALSAAS